MLNPERGQAIANPACSCLEKEQEEECPEMILRAFEVRARCEPGRLAVRSYDHSFHTRNSNFDISTSLFYAMAPIPAPRYE
jgi:hypothetical protein